MANDYSMANLFCGFDVYYFDYFCNRTNIQAGPTAGPVANPIAH